MLGIHISRGDFSDRWVDYCKQKGIPYKLVKCYSSNIIEELKECDALLWHHNHASPIDQLMAKQLLFSLEHSGMIVFPDFFTSWHFDDKLGQKYLFEALNLPSVKSYVFFSKKEAYAWSKNTTFPKVFKLRRGAGSRNVWLVPSARKARKIIRKAFGKGFRQFDAYGDIKEKVRKYKIGQAGIIDILKAVAHIWYPLNLEKAIGREQCYVYFQDFVPDNDFDIRIIVIRDKAFAIKRKTRKNDFRASGSGSVEYEPHHFNIETIKMAFNAAKKMKTACVGFDFIYQNGKPLIIEVSFGFNKYVYDECKGYWDEDLNWYPGIINPYGWMIEDLIIRINDRKRNN